MQYKSEYKPAYCYLWPIAATAVKLSLSPAVTHISGGPDWGPCRIIQTMLKLGQDMRISFGPVIRSGDPTIGVTAAKPSEDAAFTCRGLEVLKSWLRHGSMNWKMSLENRIWRQKPNLSPICRGLELPLGPHVIKKWPPTVLESRHENWIQDFGDWTKSKERLDYWICTHKL